jgi:hypothetical protein
LIEKIHNINIIISRSNVKCIKINKNFQNYKQNFEIIIPNYTKKLLCCINKKEFIVLSHIKSKTNNRKYIKPVNFKYKRSFWQAINIKKMLFYVLMKNVHHNIS